MMTLLKKLTRYMEFREYVRPARQVTPRVVPARWPDIVRNAEKWRMKAWPRALKYSPLLDPNIHKKSR